MTLLTGPTVRENPRFPCHFKTSDNGTWWHQLHRTDFVCRASGWVSGVLSGGKTHHGLR